MHVQRLTIENIRSIRRFELDLSRENNPAGWHVLLGDNGSRQIHCRARSGVVTHGPIECLRYSRRLVPLAHRRAANPVANHGRTLSAARTGMSGRVGAAELDKVPIRAIGKHQGRDTGGRRQNGHQAAARFCPAISVVRDPFGEAVKGGFPPRSDPFGASPVATVRWTGFF